MNPRVSLLIIALYTTKIFCTLSLINTSRPFQKKKIISKQSTIKIPMRLRYPPMNSSDNNNTFVQTNPPKKPITPYAFNELFMLVV
jgi:hypothetical protein